MTVRYRRRDDIRLTALDDEGVVLHLGSREYFTVSETGLVILEALREDRTEDELVQALQAEYDVTEERARESVLAFLDHCMTEELVVRTGAG